MRELSLNVLDVAQNSVAAGAAQIEIEVTEDTAAHRLMIGIYDDGKGMTEEQVRAVRDPFYTTRTTRKVGLGVPLFKMAAEMTGGSLEIESAVGVGTKVKAFFHTDHVDFVPLGDMANTVVTLAAMNEAIRFRYRYEVDGRAFVFDTQEIKAVLGDVPMNDPAIMNWMTAYIQENAQVITEVQ
jgi:signal transduction histidine kinase